MRLLFTVAVDVSRLQGKFASREELAELISQELEAANPGQLDAENGGEYEVTSWEVTQS